MASPTVPIDGSPVTPVKHTRRSDVWTTAFLVLTTVLGGWSLILIVLTVLTIAHPAFLYSDQKAALKAAGATVVGLIAIEQAYTMGAAMRKVPASGSGSGPSCACTATSAGSG